jgi:hypothetical protein
VRNHRDEGGGELRDTCHANDGMDEMEERRGTREVTEMRER